MARDVTETDIGRVPLFNSPLETGVRAVVVLDAAFPRCFDLAHLTWFDHPSSILVTSAGQRAFTRIFRSVPANCSFGDAWWKMV